MGKKSVPDTKLVQCEHCKLCVRCEESEVEKVLELPTFCDFISPEDIEYRKEECQSARWKKPKGI
jgi:hypothetical protein